MSFLDAIQDDLLRKALGRHLLSHGMMVPDVAKELGMTDYSDVYVWDVELRVEGRL